MEAHHGARRSSGFSLIEALVALTVLGFAILSGLSFLAMERRLSDRVEVHRQVIRLMENELETIRATPGAPLPGAPFGVAGGPSGLSFEVEVSTLFPDGLYGVSLAARYTLEGRSFERRVETRVWKPEG